MVWQMCNMYTDDILVEHCRAASVVRSVWEWARRSDSEIVWEWHCVRGQECVKVREKSVCKREEWEWAREKNESERVQERRTWRMRVRECVSELECVRDCDSEQECAREKRASVWDRLIVNDRARVLRVEEGARETLVL